MRNASLARTTTAHRGAARADQGDRGMPQQVDFKGVTITRPGVVTSIDVSGLANLIRGQRGVLAIVGEATGGQPTIVHSFTDPGDMIDTFVSGVLADAAQLLFAPGRGDFSRGATTVLAIKTNLSTQSTGGINSTGPGADCPPLSDRIWGTEGAVTSFALATSGAGFVLTTARTRAPLIGTTVSPTLADTAWFSATRTNAGGVVNTRITIDRSAPTLLLEIDTGAGFVTEFTVTIPATKTITDVMAEIGTLANWSTAVVTTGKGSYPANELDDQVRTALPGVAIPLWGQTYDVIVWATASNPHVTAARNVGSDNAPGAQTTEFLQGGTLGTTDGGATGDVVDALTALEAYNARFVVSGFDTTVNGTVITTINGYFRTHAINMNALGATGERQVFIAATAANLAAVQTAPQAIDDENVQMTAQRLRRANAQGTVGRSG